MQSSIYNIPLANLLLALIPVALVGVFYVRWSLQVGTLIYATIRMVSQLILIGLVLTFIFANENVVIISLILAFMLLVASWISLRPLQESRGRLYHKAFLALLIGSGSTLLIIIGGVIELSPWYKPQYLIPLAGMIFSSGMNGVSLAAERFDTEIKRGVALKQARSEAFLTGMLPTLNAYFAVGLVALPGMMTGQILSGIDPLIAVRYQIMVMCMTLGSAGLSAALYLIFASGHIEKKPQAASA